METIEGNNLARLCDYSFGDHMALWDKSLYQGMAKVANATNQEFLAKAKEFEGKIMTLFIDNIRLYPRQVRTDSENDKQLVNWLMITNNLLGLCSLLPNNQFIIFTGQEDTPLDDYIQIPINVLKIYAVNAYCQNEKVIPIPFGVQRQMSATDNRLEILKKNVEEDTKIEPTKLLYINCGIERSHDRDYLVDFQGDKWATCHFDKNTKYFPWDMYQVFLNTIKDHKFMICPKGHFDTLDCHRIWECLYMRRVPIVRKNPYYDKLLKDFPVLVVNEWSEITEELLTINDYLYQSAQTMDLSKLDLQKLYVEATRL